MPNFPQLMTGAVAQYPLQRSESYRTVVTRFIDGSDQRFRELISPVRRWSVQFDKLSADEAGILEVFFLDRQGRAGTFSFTDPHDGVEYPYCAFEDDSYATVWLSDADCQSKLIIRTVQV